MTKENPNQSSEKFKVVIFIGDNLVTSEKDIGDAVKKYGLNNVKIIRNTIENITDLSDISGRTDEDTIFIVHAHGINKENRHFIDGMPTDEFFNNLKSKLKHNINGVLFSCHGGGALKTGKINEGISLMVRASSKYETKVILNTAAILKILQWKAVEKNGFSNNEIYASLLKEDPETFYYRGGNANDKTVKFPRMGKFNLEEIKDLLKKDSEFTEDQQNKIYEAFKALEMQKKTKFETSALSFSILAIKRKLFILVKDPTIGLDKTFCDNFIKKLKIQLIEKLYPNNAEAFLKMRDLDENKARNLDAKLSPFYLRDLFLGIQ